VDIAGCRWRCGSESSRIGLLRVSEFAILLNECGQDLSASRSWLIQAACSGQKRSVEPVP